MGPSEVHAHHTYGVLLILGFRRRIRVKCLSDFGGRPDVSKHQQFDTANSQLRMGVFIEGDVQGSTHFYLNVYG